MKEKSNGSLIIQNDKIIGSKLIGQSFQGIQYFHSRPSSVDYNAQNSGASNFAPTSKKLIEVVREKIDQFKKEEAIDEQLSIPPEMVLSSGSGLDPHISIDSALIQISRIAKKRDIPEENIKSLIEENIDYDFLGIWGQSAVNVLKLNLALDNYSNQNLQ